MHLVHPHIVQLYDFGETDGIPWIAFELVQGGDLRSFLRLLGQPLPVEMAIVLLIDIASALHFAHTLEVDGSPAQVIHRDISPSNILVSKGGHFKLADFGIAKSALVASESTKTGIIKGKAYYVAPEQIEGGPMDARADLWSLGVVLFEALSGRRPFEGTSELATLLLIQRGERPRIDEIAPHVPPILSTAIERLLEPDPAKRFQSAEEVLQFLESLSISPTVRLRLSHMACRLWALTPTVAEGEHTEWAQGTRFDGEEAAPPQEQPTQTSTLWDDEAPHQEPEVMQKEAPAPKPSTTPSSPPTPLAGPPPTPAFRSLRSLPKHPLLAAFFGFLVGLSIMLVIFSSSVVDWSNLLLFWSQHKVSAEAPPVAISFSVDDSIEEEASSASTNPAEAEDESPPIGLTEPLEAEFLATQSLSPPRPRSDGWPPRSEVVRTSRSSSKFGRVLVVVSPEGTVRIDGREAGTSPFRTLLPEGIHWIEAISRGEKRGRSVRVIAGETTRVEFLFGQ
ncbi:MAG: serine/threonine protein kinase, partial [Sandaracinaceae bacterium]|nr:serine/threonine protein kinase [Sandaracinaceae bacterium]